MRRLLALSILPYTLALACGGSGSAADSGVFVDADVPDTSFAMDSATPPMPDAGPCLLGRRAHDDAHLQRHGGA